MADCSPPTLQTMYEVGEMNVEEQEVMINAVVDSLIRHDEKKGEHPIQLRRRESSPKGNFMRSNTGRRKIWKIINYFGKKKRPKSMKFPAKP